MYFYQEDHHEELFYIEPAVSAAAHRMVTSRRIFDDEPSGPVCSEWHKPTTRAGKKKLAARRAKTRAARKQNAKRRSR